MPASVPYAVIFVIGIYFPKLHFKYNTYLEKNLHSPVTKSSKVSQGFPINLKNQPPNSAK